MRAAKPDNIVTPGTLTLPLPWHVATVEPIPVNVGVPPPEEPLLELPLLELPPLEDPLLELPLLDLPPLELLPLDLPPLELLLLLLLDGPFSVAGSSSTRGCSSAGSLGATAGPAPAAGSPGTVRTASVVHANRVLERRKAVATRDVEERVMPCRDSVPPDVARNRP
jgi:hypothetical protein